jgi:hypothetical protein
VFLCLLFAEKSVSPKANGAQKQDKSHGNSPNSKKARTVLN